MSPAQDQIRNEYLCLWEESRLNEFSFVYTTTGKYAYVF